MENKWNSYYVQGNGMTNIKDKLKYLKVDLKVWNRDVFGHLETNKKRIMKEIEELDIQDDYSNLERNARLISIK